MLCSVCGQSVPSILYATAPKALAYCLQLGVDGACLLPKHILQYEGKGNDECAWHATVHAADAVCTDQHGLDFAGRYLLLLSEMDIGKAHLPCQTGQNPRQ